MRVPANSSSLYAVGHDPAQQVLEVEFLERGVVQYQNVPLEVYQEFQAASSKGTYYAASIKNNYAGEEL